MGATAIMALLNLKSAIFWGQLSRCHTLKWVDTPHYSCDNRVSYGAVSAFCSLIMIFQSFFVVFMYKSEVYLEYIVDVMNGDVNVDVNGDTTVMLGNNI